MQAAASPAPPAAADAMLSAQYLPASPNMSLLLAFFASGASSLFGAQCLVEAVLQSYLTGRTFEQIQVDGLCRRVVHLLPTPPTGRASGDFSFWLSNI
jgi:hypothetical protein